MLELPSEEHHGIFIYKNTGGFCSSLELTQAEYDIVGLTRKQVDQLVVDNDMGRTFEFIAEKIECMTK